MSSETLPVRCTALCRSLQKKASRDRTVFHYHSRTGLEYHFGGIQSPSDRAPAQKKGQFKGSKQVKIQEFEKMEGSQSHGARKDAHQERKRQALAGRWRQP
jgi:hypothetical protein